jgi:hypothetical protein
MKKGLQVIILTIAALVGASSVQGQEIPSVQVQQAQPTGAYAVASRTDKEVIQAANFAIKQAGRKNHTSISLVSIENAEQQVVAGLNYRLCLKVKIKGEVKHAGAVVYRNLKNKLSLSEWFDGCMSSDVPMVN